jgi:transposase
MERMNEIRSVYGYKTNIWWHDDIAQWMNIHRKKLRPEQPMPQRQIPGLIDLHLEQEQPIPLESEHEELDSTSWIENVSKISVVERREAASEM